MWLSRDGKKVDIEFMNAFKLSETRTYSIRDFGYMQPSRLFNVDTFTHKQEETLYINMNRNNYAAMPEYQKVIKTIFSGKEIVTSTPGSAKNNMFNADVDIVRKAKKYSK